MLTSKIKNAQTAGDLLDVVDGIVDKPIFDYIHAAAAYTKLGNFQKKGRLCPGDMNGNVLVRLDNRLHGMLVRKQVGAQGLANILWAAANLFSGIPAVLNMVPAIADQVPSKASDMKGRHIACTRTF